MDDFASSMAKIITTVIMMIALISGVFYLNAYWGNITYTETVWGKVVDQQPNIKPPFDTYTIRYTVDTKDERSGVYETKVNTATYYSIGEEVLLMCSSDYKHCKIYNEDLFSEEDIVMEGALEPSKEVMQTGVKFLTQSVKFLLVITSILAGVCVSVFIGKRFIGLRNPNLNYVSDSSMETLYRYYSDIVKIRRKCRNSGYRKALKKTKHQMRVRIKQIIAMDKVTVTDTAQDVRNFATESINVFRQISELASKQAFSMVKGDYGICTEELERALLTLKASEELEKLYE